MAVAEAFDLLEEEGSCLTVSSALLGKREKKKKKKKWSSSHSVSLSGAVAVALEQTKRGLMNIAMTDHSVERFARTIRNDTDSSIRMFRDLCDGAIQVRGGKKGH